MVVATIPPNPVDLSPDLACSAHHLPIPPYSDPARPSSLLGIDFVARVSVVLRFLVCIAPSSTQKDPVNKCFPVKLATWSQGIE